MKHTHSFNKTWEGNVEVNEKLAMEEMFGEMPPLPDGKSWGREMRYETHYLCDCGEKMVTVDMPEEDSN